jgi:hypothetical protein
MPNELTPLFIHNVKFSLQSILTNHEKPQSGPKQHKSENKALIELSSTISKDQPTVTKK